METQPDINNQEALTQLLDSERLAHQATKERLETTEAELTKAREELALIKSILEQTNQELGKAIDESLTDNLTGLFNKNYYDRFKQEHFNHENPRYDYGKTGVVYIDVNDLKQKNATFGHNGGNQVLVTVAEYLKTNFREEDTVVRLHGDEFVVICPNSNLDPDFENNLRQKARGIAENSEENLININGQNVTCDFAVGVAVYKEGDANFSEATHRADDDMYQFKQAQKEKAQSQPT